jgi:hypothetical protein
VGVRYVKASQNGKANRSGLQVSYYRVFKAFTPHTDLDDHEIENVLREALPERQRKQLDERQAA